MSADELCRQHYQRLAERFLDQGIDPAEIAKSQTFMVEDGPTCWVDPAACQPTGAALGFPLPDPAFSALLFQTARSLAEELAPLLEPGMPHFAYVPAAGYHVTLVNYSHFDCTDSKESIVSFEPATFAAIRSYFRSHRHSRPSIRFKGLILTPAGRLIVPGYGVNPDPFAIRAGLATLVPRFCTNLPRTLHIKLGHLLRNLNGPHQRECQRLLEQHGQAIDRIITFAEIYTPFQILQGCFYDE
jgi:hypothetical protein